MKLWGRTANDWQIQATIQTALLEQCLLLSGTLTASFYKISTRVWILNRKCVMFSPNYESFHEQKSNHKRTNTSKFGIKIIYSNHAHWGQCSHESNTFEYSMEAICKSDYKVKFSKEDPSKIAIKHVSQQSTYHVDFPTHFEQFPSLAQTTHSFLSKFQTYFRSTRSH